MIALSDIALWKSTWAHETYFRKTAHWLKQYLNGGILWQAMKGTAPKQTCETLSLGVLFRYRSIFLKNARSFGETSCYRLQIWTEVKYVKGTQAFDGLSANKWTSTEDSIYFKVRPYGRGTRDAMIKIEKAFWSIVTTRPIRYSIWPILMSLEITAYNDIEQSYFIQINFVLYLLVELVFCMLTNSCTCIMDWANISLEVRTFHLTRCFRGASHWAEFCFRRVYIKCIVLHLYKRNGLL